RRDLLDWIDSIGERIPDTSITPLGSELRASAGEAVGGETARILAEPFLLFVSTIESRKNHQVLCRAYAQLVDWGVTGLPRLVFAGGVGHGGRQVIDEIAADHRLRDRVTVLSGASDTELVALYERCLFTLFPSLYEGWGLPVSEALSAGKFCISSNQGSL